MTTKVESVVKYGYSDLRVLLHDVARWLSTVGWNIVFEAPTSVTKLTPSAGYTFMATPRGDATNLFDVEPFALRMACTVRSSADGYSYATIEAQATPTLQCELLTGEVINDARGVPSGNMGPADEFPYSEGKNVTMSHMGQGSFFDTSVVKGLLRAHPVSWRAAATDYGVFLCIWLEGDEQRNPPTQSWLCIQRPVAQANGEPLRDPDPVGSRNPIFAVYGISNEVNKRTATRQTEYVTFADANRIPVSEATLQGAIAVKRFVVREKDVNAPSRQTDAWRNGRDATSIVNLRQQQARIEMRDVGTASIEKAGSRYAILFPSKLNTARFRFKHELDMIAYTSADVISSGLPVSVHVYDETDPDTGEKMYRRYVAIQPTGPFNTNLIVLHLERSGIPESEVKKK